MLEQRVPSVLGKFNISNRLVKQRSPPSTIKTKYKHQESLSPEECNLQMLCKAVLSMAVKNKLCGVSGSLRLTVPRDQLERQGGFIRAINWAYIIHGHQSTPAFYHNLTKIGENLISLQFTKLEIQIEKKKELEKGSQSSPCKTFACHF